MGADPDRVPLVDLGWQRDRVDADVRLGVDRVLASTAFVGGPDVGEFETEFAAATGRQHCVGVANGTDALELALRAAGVRAGHRVVVPANSFVATAESVVRAGAAPVFVDVDDEHLLLDPAALETVADQVDAVVPVHLFGQVAPMEQICAIADQHDLVVVEDAAQAHGAARGGATIGSWGAATATSFYPGKNLGAYGDAGAVLTDDAEVARVVRLLSNHGSSVRYRHDVVGTNSRLDTLQAVVLRAKLRRLADWNALRAGAAQLYHELLADAVDVRLPAADPDNDHVWHLYVVRVADRDHVAAELHRAGIDTGVHYPVPLHRTPAFRDHDERPVADAAARRILSLPLFPGITPAQQERVAAAVRRAVRRSR